MRKQSFHQTLDEVVQRSDVILLVLDARFPDETRNKYLEQLIGENRKYLIYVINKCDLVDKEYLDKTKERLIKETGRPVVFVSAKERFGSRFLRFELTTAKHSLKEQKINIGVVGYPNVGKSSVINLLVGKARTRTSSVSGLTKGKQNIKLNEGMFLIDTPGMLDSDDEVLLGLFNAKDFDKIVDSYSVAYKIFEVAKEQVKEHYAIHDDDFESLLEKIAEKFNKKIKGNQPDVSFAAKRIIMDWQRGNITLKKGKS